MIVEPATRSDGLSLAWVGRSITGYLRAVVGPVILIPLRILIVVMAGTPAKYNPQTL